MAADDPSPVGTLIVGCGDIGCRLALALKGRGMVVTGWVRSMRSAEALRRLRIPSQLVDLDVDCVPLERDKTSPGKLQQIFYFAPPPDRGDSDTRLRRCLQSLPLPPRRLIYLSTSAVYGDSGGKWIDETAVLRPKNERGLRRLDAERAALEFAAATGTAVLILRVPGIYGPGRLPLDRLRTGAPILAEAESPFTNRIHADDLATAALTIAEHGEPGTAYNISDGQPTSMTDYFRRCAELLCLPEPPQVSMAEARRSFSPMLLSFLEESKRLDNRRLRALGWSPRYPDLSTGLPTCLRADAVVDAFKD